MVLFLILTGCKPEQDTASPTPDHVEETLASITMIDPYPVYTMHWTGPYDVPEDLTSESSSAPIAAWGCSLFAALGDSNSPLFGRNFDWEHSPMILLHTHPEEGYASVTSVDFAYLIEDEALWTSLEDQPHHALMPLLESPQLPFNGINEHGLAVAMAAVASDQYVSDPDKPTVGNLQLIRLVLENTRTTGEAATLLESVSIRNQGGPHLHYLIADRDGGAIVVEYVDGELRTISSETPWHQATNFTLSDYDQTDGLCPRFDRLQSALTHAEGALDANAAMDLLEQVSASGTQWSIVYDLSELTLHLSLARNYETRYIFEFSAEGLTLR